MKKAIFSRLVPLAIIFAVLVFLMPRNSKFPYDYKRGLEWKYETLFAQFDFPIYKSEEQLREERQNVNATIIPYFKYSEQAGESILGSVDILPLGDLGGELLVILGAIYDVGVMEDMSNTVGNASISDVIYIQRNKRAGKYPATEVYTLSGVRTKLLSDLRAFSEENVDSLLRESGVYELLAPNLIYDEQTTELVNNEELGETISPTSGYMMAGELIVSQGEIVTAEIEQTLNSYKQEYDANMGYIGPPMLIVLSNMLIAFALVALLYFIIRFTDKELFSDMRYLYVLLLFLLFSALTIFLSSSKEDFVYAVPYTLSAIMMQTFMSRRTVVPLYVAMIVPLLIFCREGAVLFVMFLVAGLVVLYLFKYLQLGWRQFVAAAITFVLLAALYLGFRGADLVAGNMGSVLIRLLIGSFLTVAGFPLTYLLERVFNLVSDSRLSELNDTSNTLIRELEQRAPGTFQHSLQVMNMADYVARSVGENPEFIRVGTLYHDIGKINNPLCFVENEFLLSSHEEDHKYHSGLSPMQSAHDIIKHVTDGVEIARKHRLPKAVVDFILTHHGTTTVRYFYNKFLEEGGDPSLRPEFMYPGPKPKTKAQVILMLCDSIEAASRTLKGNSAQVYSDFVEGIVAGKMEEGQFDEAEITISELNTVKENLKQYLAQLNHERIVYPKTKMNDTDHESRTEQS